MTSAIKPSPSQAILKSISYFSALDEPTFETVTRAAIRRSFEPGHIILNEGGQSSGLYVIESGWLKVNKISVDGREQVLKTLGPGDSFNVISIFTTEPNKVSVETLEQAVIWLIPREAMLSLLDEYPDLTHNVIQYLASQVTHLIELVEDLSLRSVVSRLARLLLEHAEGDILERHNWATQAEMSARLGTVPDVLNRALKKLVAEGFIQVARQQIKILDRSGLEEIAKIQ